MAKIYISDLQKLGILQLEKAGFSKKDISTLFHLNHGAVRTYLCRHRKKEKIESRN